MSDTPFEKLHKTFSEALRTHSYIGPTESDPLVLECTKKKHIRLKEVFKLAIDQIETDLKNDSGKIKDVTILRTLEHDGSIIYQRYTQSTNSWSRWFLKSLAHYTPDLLKKFLPACFSNEMENAEKETLEAFETYRSFLKEKIDHLSKEEKVETKEASFSLEEFEDIFDSDKDLATENKAKDSKTEAKKDADVKTPSKAPLDPKKEAELKKLREQRLKNFDGKTPIAKDTFLDEEDLEMQRLLFSTFDVQDTEDQQPIPKELDQAPVKVKKEKVDPAVALDNLLKNLYENAADSKISPPSSKKEEVEEVPFRATTDQYKEQMRDLSQLLMQLDKRPLGLQKLKNALESMTTAVTELLEQDPTEQNFLEGLGIKDKALDTLNDPKLKAALQDNDDQKVLELLDATSWHSGFKEALEQKGLITFGIRKILDQSALLLANEEGKPVKENILSKYRGQIKIGSSTDLLKELLQFLEKNKACRPYSLVIEVEDDNSFTPEFFHLLMELKEHIAEVQVEGLQEIDFEKLTVSESEELKFVRSLESFHFPQLTDIILSDHAKEDWTARDFSNLLAICPTMELLKASYQQCPAYKEIVIPSALTAATEVDVSGYSIDQAAHLLSLFSDLRYVNLSGLPYTDAQLYNLLKEANLKNVIGLQLENCKGLTTDSLPTLASLPQLRMLALPDLPKGKLPLNELPKLENPFKIKLLYTTSKATQPLAASLYTGPQIWAAVFQIPLASQGVAEIFTPNQKRLDPKSVAYWLYNGDYQLLKPQPNIVTILADSNEALCDDNLVEFVKKFPKANTISLYNCPNVTDAGIIDLLKACPYIQTLDLMGCPHITESLFFGDGNLAILQKLKKLIVTDTGISSDIVAIFNTSDQLGKRLVFEDTCLRITDEDLTDDDALERILQEHTLNKLKRIDLEDCVNLNDKMLGQLLDHLNAPAEIETPEKTLKDNPQRLNLSILNLKGCVNITEEAFHNLTTELDDLDADTTSVKAKIDPKILGNLDRVITGGTKISPVLQEVYSKVIFQEFEEPVTIKIDPDTQFEECIRYHTKKEQDLLNEDEEKELEKLTNHYLHNRIVVELFCEEPAKAAIEQPIDPLSKEFCDLTLSFQIDKKAELTSFQVHRDIMYYQSGYFLNGFRPGGKISKEIGLIFDNVHGTPEASQAVIDILYGKPCIQDLDWRTAADVAELIGSNNFKLSPSIYNALLDRIHSQFDLTNAQDLLEIANCLNDQEGKTKYENTLLFYLDSLGPKDQDIFQVIANLAGGKHGLATLQTKVAKMQQDKTNQLIKKEIEEQNAANAAEDAKAIEKLVQGDLLSAFMSRFV